MSALQALDAAILETVEVEHEARLQAIQGVLRREGYYIAPITPATTTPSRTTDPRTSHGAEAAIRLKAGTQRTLLLETFARWPDDGLTDEQAMEKSHGVSATSEYAKRCSELRAAGWIADTGKDREGNSGVPRIVSRITDLGKAALAKVST